FSLPLPPPPSPLFPYTTLFRSRLAIPASRALRVRRQGLRARCRNVAMGRAGNGSRGSIGGADPHALLPGDRGHLGRRPLGLIARSEEHTSELQSLAYLVCRLLL